MKGFTVAKQSQQQSPTNRARTSKGIVLLVACAAQFMVVLDIAIVNVALPSIQRDLGIGPGSLQWIVIAYSLMLGGFLLLGGRLADHLGRRRMFGETAGAMLLRLVSVRAIGDNLAQLTYQRTAGA